jgi:hypothetical protein
MPMENKNIHDYNFNILSALKRKHNYSTYIYVFAAGGLLSSLISSREGFCPPSQFNRTCHFHRRAVSALSFLDRRAFVL